MTTANATTLKAIQNLVTNHLGVPDDAQEVTRFIYSLYQQNATGTRDGFQEVITANGGDSFPQLFINEVYEVVRGQVSTGTADEAGKADKAVTAATHNVNPLIRLESRRSHPSPLPVVNNIYKGTVRSIKDFGVFISLYDGNVQLQPDGMCHVSQLSHSTVRHPSELVSVNQEVSVRVVKVDASARGRPRISLSMKDLDDQSNGYNDRTNRFAGSNKRRRLTSPERWEIQQLISAGVASIKDYPELQDTDIGDDNGDTTHSVNEGPQVDVELKKVKPKFLLTQNVDILELLPKPVPKDNDKNMLVKEASNGSQLMKEFRDQKLKQQKDKSLLRAQALGMADPMIESKRDEATNAVITEWTRTQKNIQYGKRTSLSMKEQRESLPIFAMREQIVKTIKDNQFVVIVGETGSGKTTQIVQYLYEEGFTKNNGDHIKMVGCTQPRRVAAVSVAKRVAEEVGLKLGETVGYTIRFEDNTGPNTAIKYMTDGMLEREALNDPDMKRYSVIMLDEAHERTIATDVLFALLKKAVVNNPQLKVIVTSATLDSNKFAKYFNNCPILQIPGRTFPVEILYTKEPETDYLASALDSVMQIHMLEGPGDILVFLTGKEEIDTSCEVLYERVQQLGKSVGSELIILPVYSSLPSEMQSRIFEPTPNGSRKVILATNIAETSITIDGIYYVVDPGFVKLNVYDSRLGMDSLMVTPISQAQANQRSGRAGRTGPGKCYRLYTEESFQKDMQPNSLPEIQRQNLAHTILMLKAIGINDVLHFDFMDPPALKSMVAALQDLFVISALDSEGSLTSLGRKMADFPMEPALAKCLISLAEYGCSDEIMTIVAMLSVQTVFFRPKEEMKAADQRKARFHHSSGDHVTLLNVYRGWVSSGHGHGSQWCKQNYIHERSMKRAQEVRRQLTQIMKRYHQPIILCGNDFNKVRWALCAGFFKNSAKRDNSGNETNYKTLIGETPVVMHPSSALFGKKPEYVIYHTLLMTTKEYMHCATTVEPQWLVECAPEFFQAVDTNERQKNEKIQPLFNRFTKDQNSWRLSNQKKLRR